MPVPTTSFRLTHEDVALFRRFRQQLQEATPHGYVSARHAFRLAVTSASAALSAGQVPTALSVPTPPIEQEGK
jgi:hypothetical protein